MKKSRVKSFLIAISAAGIMGAAAPSIGTPSAATEYRYIGHSGISQTPAVFENPDTTSPFLIALGYWFWCSIKQSQTGCPKS